MIKRNFFVPTINTNPSPLSFSFLLLCELRQIFQRFCRTFCSIDLFHKAVVVSSCQIKIISYKTLKFILCCVLKFFCFSYLFSLFYGKFIYMETHLKIMNSWNSTHFHHHLCISLLVIAVRFLFIFFHQKSSTCRTIIMNVPLTINEKRKKKFYERFFETKS